MMDEEREARKHLGFAMNYGAGRDAIQRSVEQHRVEAQRARALAGKVMLFMVFAGWCLGVITVVLVWYLVSLR